MTKNNILIFGNSGSGKSTLAKKYSVENSLAHFDLDTVAWQDTTPPIRKEMAESLSEIKRFINENNRWVIEGCYSDLLNELLTSTDFLIFINPSVETCIENARNRPWEPHKYESKEAQDKNLEMLINWIQDYTTRDDEFSLRAHRIIYDNFNGEKIEYHSNER